VLAVGFFALPQDRLVEKGRERIVRMTRRVTPYFQVRSNTPPRGLIPAILSCGYVHPTSVFRHYIHTTRFVLKAASSLLLFFAQGSQVHALKPVIALNTGMFVEARSSAELQWGTGAREDM